MPCSWRMSLRKKLLDKWAELSMGHLRQRSRKQANWGGKNWEKQELDVPQNEHEVDGFPVTMKIEFADEVMTGQLTTEKKKKRNLQKALLIFNMQFGMFPSYLLEVAVCPWSLFYSYFSLSSIISLPTLRGKIQDGRQTWHCT